MSYAIHKQLGSFSCAICGKALTDSASISEGIGPICRQKANEILAKEFLLNLDVQFIAICITPADLPEICRERWATIFESIYSQKKVAKNDWRNEVKGIVWILSHGMKSQTREVLIQVVEMLGYKGFANLLRGLGVATASFNNGSLHLVVKAQKDENYKFYGLIKPWLEKSGLGYFEIASACRLKKDVDGKGTKEHGMRRFQLSIRTLNGFEAFAQEAYPFLDGLAETIEQAKKYASDNGIALLPLTPVAKEQPVVDLDATKPVVTPIVNRFLANIGAIEAAPVTPAAQPVVVPVKLPDAPKATIYTGKKANSVACPYNAAFVTKIKGLSWRTFNGKEKTWLYMSSDNDKVIQFLKDCFPGIEIETKEYAAA